MFDALATLENWLDGEALDLTEALETINAALIEATEYTVAYSDDIADAYREANYAATQRAYRGIVRRAGSPYTEALELTAFDGEPTVDQVDDLLDLARSLDFLATDYPVFNDEDLWNIEDRELIDSLTRELPSALATDTASTRAAYYAALEGGADPGYLETRESFYIPTETVAQTAARLSVYALA